MIKNTSDNSTLKCHLTVEEPKELAEKNALIVGNTQDSLKIENKFKVTQIKTEIKSKRNWLEKILPELYNLEDRSYLKKMAKIELDLDIYQMESI